MKSAPEPNPKAREQCLAHTTTCVACAPVERKEPGADGMALALDVIYSEPVLRARETAKIKVQRRRPWSRTQR